MENPKSNITGSASQNTREEDNTPRVIFKMIATIVLVALVLSVSRIFLSLSDRGGLFLYYNYNVYISTQMMAFLSVVLISAVLLIVGAFLAKEYDVIGTPMLISGMFSLVFITIMAYFSKGVRYGITNSEIGMMQGEIVLTLAIVVEWIGLATYCWLHYPPTSKFFVNRNI